MDSLEANRALWSFMAINRSFLALLVQNDDRTIASHAAELLPMADAVIATRQKLFTAPDEKIEAAKDVKRGKTACATIEPSGERPPPKDDREILERALEPPAGCVVSRNGEAVYGEPTQNRHERILLFLNIYGPSHLSEIGRGCRLSKGQVHYALTHGPFCRAGWNEVKWAATRVSKLWPAKLSIKPSFGNGEETGEQKAAAV